MSKIPLPERGQPLDLSYIYQLATAINQLSSSISLSTYKYLTIDTKTSNGRQSIRTSEAKIIGAYVDVTSSAVTGGTTEISKTYSFSNYRVPPVVTASIVNDGGTPAGEDASVVITKVTTSEVGFKVKFRTSGNVNVGVNLIIVGLPE